MHNRAVSLQQFSQLHLILLGFAVLWGLAIGFIGLAADEAYYWTWSKNLQWGYYDHAPMIAWWIRLGTSIFGDTNFGVRALGPLAMMASAMALWRTVDLLTDRTKANICALVFCSIPMVWGNAVIVTPDTPAMLFWALSLWAVAERLASGNRNWWLLVGLFAGFGLLSKYSILFLGAGLFLCIVTSKDLRRDIFSWQLWLGGVIALLLFAPVVQWNASYDWISFSKQFGRIGETKNYDPRYLPELIGAVFFLFFPGTVIFAVIGIFHFWKSKSKELSVSAHLAVMTSLPFILYLIWHAQFARVQGNWPAPLCFAMVLALANILTVPNYKKFVNGLAPVGMAIMVLVFIYAGSPVGFIQGNADKTNQMRGWDEFGAKVLNVALSQNTKWIATNSYTLTASLRWALRNQPKAIPVVQLTERSRYTFEAQPEANLLKEPAIFIANSLADHSFLTDRFSKTTPIPPVKRGIDGQAEAYQLILISDPISEVLSP